MTDTLHLPLTSRLKLQRAARRNSRSGKPVCVSVFTGILEPVMPFGLSLIADKTIPEAVRHDFETKLRDMLTQYGSTVNNVEVELYWKSWGISISSLWLLLHARISLS